MPKKREISYMDLRYQTYHFKKMALVIKNDQLGQLDKQIVNAKIEEIFLEYVADIREHDIVLSDQIFNMDKKKRFSIFRSIYDLTTDIYYQKALLAIIVSSGLNIFEQREFRYILGHQFLSGDSKARHIVISSLFSQKG
ncbi:hypothetical protein [Dyadobacter fanqingshengii]|uniref:Uncharacterized protein n=1 Tax=Dyadobacter fanqingshengii TaxID=2906443 RepID=A0A9X1PFJ9_9BACT|nr:hypothetical protein [Dyadobacter fanqingshengii]MCF0043637.1 hypothetical protein [Dyadobacter fanqingshengii]USJ34747.1 hypothetical protein NFI81_18790 [Dyadobacter fanqingshengii]